MHIMSHKKRKKDKNKIQTINNIKNNIFITFIKHTYTYQINNSIHKIKINIMIKKSKNIYRK